MARLEEITPNTVVKGLRPDSLVTITSVKWIGNIALEVSYKDEAGRPDHDLLYRDREPTLEIIDAGRPWSFDGDGALLRLASEAKRISLAYLFDPRLAVHTSLVEPLPHQITAVYGEMIRRQPLRFLLADDPGAGKTIMAGLLIRELMIRGDVQRCLVVCPGNLAEQWQDELYEKFRLPFELMTNDKLAAARTGNWLSENPLAICRLDKLSRDEDVQAQLDQTDWDLIVCDEAHKMSASYFGNEVKYTKRYHLGQRLSGLTRHFLLMTATPHNGKEADFQLFMALLDGDRFEGRFREGVHVADTADMMRRLLKEDMVRFDGRPLFPERRAYTAEYELSDPEAALYKDVTDYVRTEFNRADNLQEGRRGTVGFALTILQRRLASSPEAICQSLRRRRERLEKRLREEELLKRGAEAKIGDGTDWPILSNDDLDDLDDLPEAELEETEEQIVDLATAARTIAELKNEIETLRQLEAQANRVRQSRVDRKWEELSALLQNQGEMFDAHGHRRKLVIFTEHRDTLNYLADQVRDVLGSHEAVVTIHGGMGRDERRNAQNGFTQDKEVQILVATDAAGEGINLQRAHLMVNYDLPWNPNRLEQRFGRIHRIGQTEVCHLWNLVAAQTREGEVFLRLCKKLEVESAALQGRIFDVLGKAFGDRPLRQLLVEAIRYGDRPEVRARLTKVVDEALDREHIQGLVDEQALAQDSMDSRDVQRIREDMERADARRLQPHFVKAFFIEAFSRLGGAIREREAGRYEIRNVPAIVRSRDRQIGVGLPVLIRYERITFEKALISTPGEPVAEFVCPGHPLLDAVIDITLEQHRSLLKQGAVLVDVNDPGEDVRALLYVDHSIHDARVDRSGNRRVVSRELHFVEIDEQGQARMAGYAPYLDYEPISESDRALVEPLLDAQWLNRDVENVALGFAVEHLVPRHYEEFKRHKAELIEKTRTAVHDRLTREIAHWDRRAEELKDRELAGKKPRMNSGKARQRADELQARLQRRMGELDREQNLSPAPPNIVGGVLVVPGGLLARLRGARQGEPATFARETKRVEAAAMLAVMETERRLKFAPEDVSKENRGYDIESRVPGTGKLRFVEVKGRIQGAKTVTVTKNEILAALNKPDDFILAIALVPASPDFDEGDTWQVGEEEAEYGMLGDVQVRYVRRPFVREPDFGVTSVNYDLGELLAKSEGPT